MSSNEIKHDVTRLTQLMTDFADAIRALGIDPENTRTSTLYLYDDPPTVTLSLFEDPERTKLLASQVAPTFEGAIVGLTALVQMLAKQRNHAWRTPQ